MEFLITPSSELRDELWFVFRSQVSPSSCVAVCGSEAEARERAIAMAQYHASADGLAQVHLRLADQKDWRTIWCSPDTEPRYRWHED